MKDHYYWEAVRTDGTTVFGVATSVEEARLRHSPDDRNFYCVLMSNRFRDALAREPRRSSVDPPASS